MKKFSLLLILILLSGHAKADDTIEGAYSRVSLLNMRTGESPEAANRKGLLILAHGHYSMMTMNPDRRSIPADELKTLAASEQIEYLEEWLDINAHSGRYQADGDALTWFRDISENPKEVNTVSRLNYALEDDLLSIYFTLPNGDRYAWTWRRMEE